MNRIEIRHTKSNNCWPFCFPSHRLIFNSSTHCSQPLNLHSVLHSSQLSRHTTSNHCATLLLVALHSHCCSSALCVLPAFCRCHFHLLLPASHQPPTLTMSTAAASNAVFLHPRQHADYIIHYSRQGLPHSQVRSAQPHRQVQCVSQLVDVGSAQQLVLLQAASALQPSVHRSLPPPATTDQAEYSKQLVTAEDFHNSLRLLYFSAQYDYPLSLTSRDVDRAAN